MRHQHIVSSFEPIIDDELIVPKYICLYPINDSHHQHRLRHDGLTVNLRLSDVHNPLCVVLVALLIAEKLNHSVHSFQYLSYICSNLSVITFITSAKAKCSFQCIFFRNALHRSNRSWSVAKASVNNCRFASRSRPLLSNVA